MEPGPAELNDVRLQNGQWFVRWALGRRRGSGASRITRPTLEQVSGRAGEKEKDEEKEKDFPGYMPGKPPLPRMASNWRIIFLPPPPFIIFIICCIC